MRSACLIILLLAAAGCHGSGMLDGLRIPVTIDPSGEADRLDERYIGFAFDTAQFTGGKWWALGSHEREVAPLPDLESPKFRKLVSYLAPSLMRIGGTDCDGAYFCPEEGDCEPPEAYANAFRDKENRVASTFTHEDIRRAADFAEAVGAKIMFCLNVGPGPRDCDTGAWTPDNARALIRYAKSLPNGHVFEVWEPGNEVNSINFNFDMPAWLTPEMFAADLETFRALVDEEDPGASVAAPGSYIYPIWEIGNFTPRLMVHAGETIDILTWHLYATQSERCGEGPLLQPFPPTRENLFDEALIAKHRHFARVMRASSRGMPVWNGESASAQCGGQWGVSDTLLDALWYADWLGIMAEEGTSTVVRQTIVGSDYGIIDPDTYDPRPTLLALAMFRRTVEGYRLKTLADRGRIKAHGFCGAGMDGSMTVVLVNPGHEKLLAEIVLSGNEVLQARQWTIGADGDPTAMRAAIEGEMHGADGTLPDPPGTPVGVKDGKAFARIEPNSLVFVSMELLRAIPLCR